MTPDGRVIGQLGRSRLPIVKLPEFSPVDTFARDLTGAILVTEKPAQPGSKPTLDTNPGAARIRIADIDYFAYVRPVRIDGSGRNCPTASSSFSQQQPAATGQGAASSTAATAGRAGPAGPAGTPAPATAAGAGTSLPASGSSVVDSCQLYLVGLMPSGSLRRAWLAPPPLVLAGFGLGLILILALLPLTRLLLIGGAELVGAVEVGAIVFGTQAAAAIAALILLFSFEAAGERRVARQEATRLATSLANRAGGEIGQMLERASRCTPQTKGSWSWDDNVLEASSFTDQGLPDAERLACRTPLPSSTDISSRPYFRKLQQQVDLLPWRGGHYTLGQVRAQTDGISKTVLLVAPASDPSRPLLLSSISRTFLRPILPAPQRFMVVDASDDTLPVLFHSRPGRALNEHLATDLAGAQTLVTSLKRGLAAAEGQSAIKDDAVLSFRRRYDGVVNGFSAAPIPRTNWVVLVYHPLEELDLIAASTALRAVLSWAVVAMIAMAFCGWELFRHRSEWRSLWPFRNAEPVYRTSIPVILAAAALIVILALAAPWLTPLPAIAITASLSLWVYWRLRARPLTPEPLCLATERSYRALVLSMMICVGAAPMAAFWSDARTFSRDLVEFRPGQQRGRGGRRSRRPGQRPADGAWRQPAGRPARPVAGRREDRGREGN